MLEPVVTFFDKLVTEFSWRRLLMTFCVVMTLAGGAWWYEQTSGTLRLGRLDREVALLDRLSKVVAEPTLKENPELRAIFDHLREKLADSATPRPESTVLGERSKQALSAAAAWVVLGFLVALAAKGGQGSLDANTVGGMLLFGIPCVLIAVALPVFEHRWINYVIYPVGHIVIVVGGIIMWQRKKAGGV